MTIRNATLAVADTTKVQGGFLLSMVQYAAKKGEFTVQDLTRRFVGKVAPTKGEKGAKARVTTTRIIRYVYWCKANGIFQVQGA